PTDLSPVSPDDPSYAAKQLVLAGTPWQGKTSLLQGDGSLAIDFLPVPMMRLAVSLQPPDYSSSTVITQIKVAKSTLAGAIGDSDVTQLELVYDSNNDGVFQPESAFNGPPLDQLLSTTTFV